MESPEILLIFKEIKRLRDKDLYFKMMLKSELLANVCGIKKNSFKIQWSRRALTRRQEKTLRAYVNTLKDQYREHEELHWLSRRAIRNKVIAITQVYIKMVAGMNKPPATWGGLPRAEGMKYPSMKREGLRGRGGWKV